MNYLPVCLGATISPMAAQQIIASYYRAWVNNDRSGARGLVTDDLKFRSPQGNFNSANEFFDACWQYAAGFDALDIVHEVYADAGGYIAYRLGDGAVGEFIVIRAGKIAEIYVTFGVTV